MEYLGCSKRSSSINVIRFKEKSSVRALQLRFAGTDSPELLETFFRNPWTGEERRCIRGRDNGAYVHHENFQFTRSVLALSIFFLRAAAAKSNEDSICDFSPLLVGESSSPASSLDYALDKQPSWLLDMFGCDLRGASVAKHIIKRTNPGRKWAGPVALALNSNFLPEKNISILVNDEKVESREILLELAKKLEQAYQSNSAGNRVGR